MKRLSLLIAILFSCCLFLVDTSVVDAKIVCVIYRDIFVMEDDGTKRRRLTKTQKPMFNVATRWSPDGERIVFVRWMNQNDQKSPELFIMNADGTNEQRLTDNNFSDYNPSWSPDGTKLAFSSGRNGSNIYVMDLATRHVTQLTRHEGAKREFAFSPDWSPDGRQIVYERITDIGRNIYVMSADGTNQRPLLDPKPVRGMQRFTPRWSADGKRIVFDDCAWPEGKQECRLSIATIGGRISIVQGIHDKLGDDIHVGRAVWMNTDKSLLLDIKLPDEPNANYDIYRYDLNTQKLIRLTDGEANEDYPHWIEGSLPVAPEDKKK